MAILALSAGAAAPGTAIGSIPLNIDPFQLISSFLLPLAGSGSGQGYATLKASLSGSPGLVGVSLSGQWFVVDPGAQDGIAATQAATWIVH